VGYLEKGFQTPVAQGQSITIISIVNYRGKQRDGVGLQANQRADALAGSAISV